MSDLLALKAGDTTVTVDTAHGATITSFVVEPWGNLLAERTSELPLRASQSTSYGDEQLDWLSEYDGGWHVLFPNAGDACVVDGIPLPFHGEASRAQWQVHEVSARSASLSTVCRLPLRLHRRITVSAGRVLVEETATNLSSRDQHVLWGQHPVFPATPGTRIDLPGGKVTADTGYSPAAGDLTPGGSGAWPSLDEVDLSVVPAGACERYACVTDLEGAWAAVRDPARGVGVVIGFDASVYPLLWLWLEAEGTDFPWLGNVRYLGVEPHSSWPGSGLASAIEQGRATVIPAGGSVTAWTSLTAFAATEQPVTGVDADGRPVLAS
jgi:galactose mutarotase-like enzyme